MQGYSNIILGDRVERKGRRNQEKALQESSFFLGAIDLSRYQIYRVLGHESIRVYAPLFLQRPLVASSSAVRCLPQDQIVRSFVGELGLRHLG
jgi:hypothetical protein